MPVANFHIKQTTEISIYINYEEHTILLAGETMPASPVGIYVAHGSDAAAVLLLCSPWKARFRARNQELQCINLRKQNWWIGETTNLKGFQQPREADKHYPHHLPTAIEPLPIHERESFPKGEPDQFNGCFYTHKLRFRQEPHKATPVKSFA